MITKQNHLRQQAAGSGRLFDSPLKGSESKKMTDRTMGILSYFFKESKWVNIEQYRNEISSYLRYNFNLQENKSNKLHFARKPLFFGFLEYDNKRGYRITHLGELFYGAYSNDDELKCIEVILEQLTKTKYPNKATIRVDDNVKTYPFRMLFYFLLKYGSLTKKFLQNQFPYIINSNFLNDKCQLSINDMSIGETYSQFYSWDVGTLKDIGILNKDKNGSVSINNKYMDEVKYYFEHYSALDCFHSEERLNFIKNRYDKIERDTSLSRTVKERDNYTCKLTGKQADWSGNDLNPYVVAHHVIPMEYHLYYLKESNVDINCLDNLLTLLVEVHACIHHGCDKDRKNYLFKAFELLSREFKSKTNLTKDKYLKLYKYKEDYQERLFC